MIGPAKHITTLVGVVLIGVHVALFGVLGKRCKGTSLKVRVKAPRTAEKLTMRFDIPEAIRKRVKTYLDGKPAQLATAKAGPGMHRAEWRVHYAGGFERRVGFTQIVGPFQHPGHPVCASRMYVGQSFLDDGKQSPGTAIATVKKVIEKEMKGFSQWPAGGFDRVRELSARWIDIDNDKWSDDLNTTINFENLKDRPTGYLGVSVVVRLDHATIELKVGVVPRIKGAEIDLKAYVDASVKLDNRVYDWVAKRFDIDDRVAKQVQDEMRDALTDVITLPPPVKLPGDRKLSFMYCPTGKIQVKQDRYAMIPLTLRLDGAHPGVLPVHLGAAKPVDDVPRTAPLSFELELDTINAILYYLWHTNFLDEQLETKGRIEERFNENSIVKELLSIRLANIRLSLPPTATATANPPGKGPGFEIAAAATMDIRDDKGVTRANVFSTIGFDFVGGDSKKIVAKLHVHDLEVTCEPQRGLLEPCYSDIVDVMRDRSDALHGELTREFTETFNKLVLNRDVGSADALAKFHIDGARVYARRNGRTGTIRVDINGAVKED